MHRPPGSPPAPLSDEALQRLLADDPDRGWETFVHQHTRTLLALIERGGVTDHDEAMEVYVQVCERLAAADCARLRQHDPAKGPLGAWLARVVRHAMVDWIRSRAGRRRLFTAVRDLAPLDRRVFELYYWEQRGPIEVAERLHMESGREVGLAGVLDALARIDAVLKDRQRSELVSFVARAHRAVSLEASAESRPIDPPDPTRGPEDALVAAERRRAAAAALAGLPAEDAVIVRLKFFEGLSDADIGRVLHLDGPIGARIQRILDGLRARLRAAPPPARQEGGTS